MFQNEEMHCKLLNYETICTKIIQKVTNFIVMWSMLYKTSTFHLSPMVSTVLRNHSLLINFHVRITFPELNVPYVYSFVRRRASYMSVYQNRIPATFATTSLKQAFIIISRSIVPGISAELLLVLTRRTIHFAKKINYREGRHSFLCHYNNSFYHFPRFPALLLIVLLHATKYSFIHLLALTP